MVKTETDAHYVPGTKKQHHVRDLESSRLNVGRKKSKKKRKLKSSGDANIPVSQGFLS